MSQRVYKKSPSPTMKREMFKLYYKLGWQQTMIAEKFGYPVYTVQRVLAKMDENRKVRSDKGKKKNSPTLELPDIERMTLDGESPETQVEMFIQSCMRAVSQSKKVKASQAITHINQLTNALRRLRSIQFANMAKSVDVKIVEAIIRKYEPGATDLKVIEIFKEASAIVKAKQ